VPAEPAGTEPALNRFLQDRLLFVGMTPPAVNDAHTLKVGSHGREQEFIERKSRFLLIHSVQVKPGLNGKTP
jgi:hypothetical protein